MRLLHCQLQNVRLHGDLELAFSPRLTLIGGPNESGKSTLVEALHRALFLKASATGAPVEALQSRLHMGQPTVELGFEARGDTWTLRKRFSGSTGQVSLQAASGARPLSGPVAEELLAELVGVSETLGSRQANTALPSRWAHLWVAQGAAGNNLLEAGRSSYDFDRLRLQLEHSGGAAVQQSAHDQLVEQRLHDALAENFTSRGTKKHSPLYQRQEDLRAAHERMKLALARLEDFEAASDELRVLSERLEQQQAVELPALKERQRLQERSAAEATRLEGAIQLSSQTLEPIRLRHDAAAQALQQLDSLTEEIKARQQRLVELQASGESAQAREDELAAIQHQHRSSWEALTGQRQTLEQRQQWLQLLVERTSKAESLERLSSELALQQQRASQRQGLEQQLAALPAMGKPQLQQLRELQQQLRDARTRQQAMAAGVKLLQADQPVWLDGQPLQVGDERRLSAVFQLQVGDGVVLEIAPGGGQALEDLDRAVLTADGLLAERFAALAVSSVEAADALLEQRVALEQQLAALGTAAPEQITRLERECQALQQRLADLDAELPAYAATRELLEQEQPLQVNLEGLQTLQQQISRTLQHTRTAAQTAEKDLEPARAALQQFKQQRLDEGGELQRVRGELADRQQRLDGLISLQGDREAQSSGLAALARELQQAERELARLQAERSALGSQDPEQQQQLEEQIAGLKGSMEELLVQRGAAKQRCDSISADDPFAAVEQARLQLENAEADHRQLLRLTEAHRLLLQLFQEAQADLSSRYSEPLAQAIGEYLRPLVPDGPAAKLSYDQTRGFQGLQLRRGQEFYDFDALSGGMREQLAAALRLSMADVLRHAYDGCLPLVFDDAFTNADPERIDLVKRMLGTAVERGLQVILLTCDPAAYGSFAEQVGEQVVELGTS